MNFSEKDFEILKRGEVKDLPENELQTLCESFLRRLRIPFIHLKYVYKYFFTCPKCYKKSEITLIIKDNPGVPDLVIFLPTGTAFVELKARKGRLSKKQKAFFDELPDRYEKAVIRNLSAFKSFINNRR